MTPSYELQQIWTVLKPLYPNLVAATIVLLMRDETTGEVTQTTLIVPEKDEPA